MCVNDVCVIKLIEWKMDGWIGLSGCGCGGWKVESGAVPDLTLIRPTATVSSQRFVVRRRLQRASLTLTAAVSTGSWTT